MWDSLSTQIKQEASFTYDGDVIGKWLLIIHKWQRGIRNKDTTKPSTDGVEEGIHGPLKKVQQTRPDNSFRQETSEKTRTRSYITSHNKALV